MKHADRAIAVLIASALAGVALAQAPANQTPGSDQKLDFAAVDKDASGRLSKQETLGIADLEAAFEKLDADHDSALTPEEFSHWARAGKASLPPRDPATVPGGSAGAQHMPPTK